MLTRLLLLILILGQGDVVVKKICTVCNGNGFVRVPFEQAKEEQWADCDFCKNQGEIEVEDEDDTVREVEH